ncbi:MAG: hypothetical protein KKI06_07350 [Euryarchaeota archaeon]|nr:hypothetical protein [Euryarchaeota archaeon]MBU4221706.1 hypothetical protein [Euryarchaeota archaeon]MCG2737493.1 hypothetical protein [Candidatus Methanoperedenaceae archaeon]
MAVKSVSTLVGSLKEKYDKSKDRSSWRVLQGMDKDHYNTFIAGDRNLWQIRSEEVAAGEMVAVGMRIARMDEELEKIMKQGSPVPFGNVTPQRNKPSIVMAGVQTYSSDSSSLLCRELLSSKQAELEQKLKGQVEKMKDDPAFRMKYNEHKDRLRRAYI